ncbi:MAG: flagellar hook-basal body complex protein FliE [Bryobacteraceae bacterium]
MPTPIVPPSLGQVAAVPGFEGRSSAPGGAQFEQFFREAVAGVEQLHQNANRTVDSLLKGENQELHNTVLAAQRAELSFELFLQMRNKLVQAYQEVMRMQL